MVDRVRMLRIFRTLGALCIAVGLSSCAGVSVPGATTPSPHASAVATQTPAQSGYMCVSNEDTLAPTATVPHGLEPHGPIMVIYGAENKYGSDAVSCPEGGRFVEGSHGICVVSKTDLESNRPAVTDILPAVAGVCSSGSFIPANGSPAWYCAYSYTTSLDTPYPYMSRVAPPPTSKSHCPNDAITVPLGYGTPPS